MNYFYTFVGIFILCLVASFFIIRWLRLKKEVFGLQLQIIQMEKNEAILRDELQKVQQEKVDEQKVSEYEKSKLDKIIFATVESHHLEIVRDLYRLISQRLKNIPEKDEYLEKLCRIPDAFFLRIEKEYRGGIITDTNMTYCVCFFIKMELKHISECLSIEPRTVKAIKARIKDKFNVNMKFNIELFLEQMMHSEEI